MGTLPGTTASSARRAGATPAVALLACLLLLVACGPGVPEVDDPLAGASTGSVPLPDNVGPSGCNPVSPAERLPDGATELKGSAAANVALWAKVDPGTPVKQGVDIRMTWRIPGVSQLRLLALGPDGARVEPTQVMPTSAPAWTRPGDAWTSTFRLPAAGCWRVNAQRGQIHGDVWFEVV